MADQGLTWGKQHFDDPIAWGRDLERRHAWLLHVGNLAVGQVERFFTGVDNDKYQSAVDGSFVEHGVFMFTTGHALLTKPENFIEIGPDEALIYINTIDKLRKALTEAVQEAAAVLRKGSDRPELPMALILSAFRSQLHALEASIKPEASAQTEPAPAGDRS